MKRQPSEREKLITNETAGKGSISKIYKQLRQLNIRKMNSAVKEWAECLNRRASKEDMSMANKHRKRGSTSRITRETKIKTTLRYHFTPIRMATFKKIYKQ